MNSKFKQTYLIKQKMSNGNKLNEDIHEDWLLNEHQQWEEYDDQNSAPTEIFKLYKSNTNLMNYYYFLGVFGADTINKILSLISQHRFIDGNITTTVDPSYRRSKVQWILRSKESYFLYRIIMWYAIKANQTMWNFDITNALESIQYAEYHAEQEGFYDWHVDVGTTSLSASRKLTIVVQLSGVDEYEGGELCIRPSRTEYECPKEAGTIIVFPSYILHKVKPVTRGIRKSLVIWLHGPSFK